MAKQYGKAALQLIKEFRSTKWFTSSFIDFANKISKEYSGRSEVMYGFALSAGTTGATALNIGVTAGEVMLAGKLHPQSAIGDDRDLHAANLLLFKDGSTAKDVIIAAATAGNFISIIALNSDNSGDVVAEGAAPKIIGICNGTDSDSLKDSTQPLSSAEIASALAASDGVHDGYTGWVHIGYIHGNIQGDSETVVSNLNNHLGL